MSRSRRCGTSGLAAGSLAGALAVVLTACGSGVGGGGAVPMPSAASSLPGTTLAAAWGTPLVGERGLLPGPEQAEAWLARSGIDAEWSSGEAYRALVLRGQRSGYASLAASRLFGEAWTLVGAPAVRRAADEEPQRPIGFGYVDLQLLTSAARDAASAMAAERAPVPVPLERVETILGSGALRFLAFSMDALGDRIDGVLAHAPARSGLVALFAAPADGATAPLAPPGDDVLLAVDLMLDRDALARTVEAVFDDDGGPTTGGMSGMAASFLAQARPWVRAAVEQVGGPAAFRLAPQGGVVAVAVRDPEAVADLLDRWVAAGEGESWQLGPLKIRLDAEGKVLLAEPGDAAGAAAVVEGVTGAPAGPSAADPEWAAAVARGATAFDGAALRFTARDSVRRLELTAAPCADGAGLGFVLRARPVD